MEQNARTEGDVAVTSSSITVGFEIDVLVLSYGIVVFPLNDAANLRLQDSRGSLCLSTVEDRSYERNEILGSGKPKSTPARAMLEREAARTHA